MAVSPANSSTPPASFNTSLSALVKVPPPEKVKVLAPMLRAPPEWLKVDPEEISTVESKL